MKQLSADSMKKYLFVFALLITGNYNHIHSMILDQYSWMIRKDITVHVVDYVPYCPPLKDGRTLTGCTLHDIKNGVSVARPDVYVASSIEYLWDFERILLHEVAHSVLNTKNEKRADAFAKDMMTFNRSIRLQ